MDVFRTELNRTAVTRNGRDDSGPGVIESAFGLLEVLCALGRARVSDLTEESGLPRTTVYRLLGQQRSGRWNGSARTTASERACWFLASMSRRWSSCALSRSCR